MKKEEIEIIDDTFTKHIHKAIPLYFDEEMSYYEVLCTLKAKVKEIITKTNSNDTKLINLYNELNDYTHNYFDNLDVQEEINKKLDIMATDGTLERIINKNIFNDINKQVAEINEKLENQTTVFVGDSYALGVINTDTKTEFVKSWTEYLKDLLKLSDNEYYRFAESGAGFSKAGISGNNFLQILQQNINSITDKNKVVRVVCCGGYNDYNQTGIYGNIRQFLTYCKSVFPNAKIYIGMIGNCSRENSDGRSRRISLNFTVLNYYSRCFIDGGIYIKGCENILHKYSYMCTDGSHPTQEGYSYIAGYIYNFLQGGGIDVCEEVPVNATINSSDIPLTLYNYLNNDITTIACINSGTWTLTEPIESIESNAIPVGHVTLPYVRVGANQLQIPVKSWIQANNKIYAGICLLYINENGNIYLNANGLNPEKNINNTKWTITNLQKINIPQFSYSFSTRLG